MKLDHPVPLSEVKGSLIIEENEGEHKDGRYEVQVAPSSLPYLFLVFGQDARTPKAKWKHPNIVAQRNRIFEFKHYRRGGGKFWTSRAGTEFLLAIPRNLIMLLPEMGYSYIPATINGVRVRFNVSGGCGNNVWTDYIWGDTVHCSVGHSLKDLKKIADVAIPNVTVDPEFSKPMEPNQQKQWDEIVGKNDYKAAVLKAIAAGTNPSILLKECFSFYSGCKQAGFESLIMGKKKAIRDATPEEQARGFSKVGFWKDTARVKSIICLTRDGRVRVKEAQVDWEATAKALANAVEA